MPMMMMNQDTKLAPKKTRPVTGSRAGGSSILNAGMLRRNGCPAASFVRASERLMPQTVNALLTNKTSRNAG